MALPVRSGTDGLDGLAGGIKPQRGDLDTRTRELVERTLDAYIEEYATLYGTRDAVYALDPVGGAYVFGTGSHAPDYGPLQRRSECT